MIIYLAKTSCSSKSYPTSKELKPDLPGLRIKPTTFESEDFAMDSMTGRLEAQEKLVNDLVYTLRTTLVISGREARLLQSFAAGILNSLQIRDTRVKQLYHDLVENMTIEFLDLDCNNPQSGSNPSKPESIVQGVSSKTCARHKILNSKY
jgi:hypothetical protein